MKKLYLTNKATTKMAVANIKPFLKIENSFLQSCRKALEVTTLSISSDWALKIS